MEKPTKIYSGREFSDALLRRRLSITDFARSIGLSPSTVGPWCKGGVPVKHQGIVMQRLDDAEFQHYGAHHQDMFPDTVKGQL